MSKASRVLNSSCSILNFCLRGRIRGMTTCPNCGAQNDANNRFCDQCGTRLDAVAPPAAPVAGGAGPDVPATAAATCPNCGSTVLPGEAFCDNCGADLSGLAAAPAAEAPTLLATPVPTGGPA